jgi:predicted nucleic acid-binding Zn ribbon protein
VTRYRRGPRPLEGAFSHLADQLAPDTLLGEVQRAWPGAVGEMIAAEARPTAERGGVVTVSCSASVWAQELDLLAPQILAQLNGRLRQGSVLRLRCVAVGHSATPLR